MGKTKKKTRSKGLTLTNWVVKRNEINGAKPLETTPMTITQKKLFAVYLSRINPKDIKSRVVIFKASEYAKLLDIELHEERLKVAADALLRVIVTIKEDKYHWVKVQLFRKIESYKNKSGEWCIRLDCHSDLQQFIFNIHEYFTQYQLWNVLRLSSDNQFALYEKLKQWEYKGFWEVSVTELRDILGIKKSEYERWDHFKLRVLNACQKELAKKTDIKFEWTPCGKRGRGGKILNIRFDIYTNEDYDKQLTLAEFNTVIATVPSNEPAAVDAPPIICNGAYKAAQIDEFRSIAVERLREFCAEQDLLTNADKLIELLHKATLASKNVKSPYRYTRKLLNAAELPAFLLPSKTSSSENSCNNNRKRSKFANFDGPPIDYNEIERMEQEYISRLIAKIDTKEA